MLRRREERLAALETSLVEWKRLYGVESENEPEPLGNFLSGMETSPIHAFSFASPLLGNFLSGMETRNTAAFRGDLHPLETSLVEWKPPRWRGSILTRSTLETSLVEWKLRGIVSSLFSQLALETSLVEWKHLPNSVSGAHVTGLGNFLSGMETADGRSAAAVQYAPWKLP